MLENLEFPEPVIHVAVEPKTKVDQDKMGKALFSLSEEDPTFQVRTDEDTGQTVISGMGELHLEVIVDRMLREFKVDATVGKPQVAYRETITQTVTKHTYTHKKQTGGKGQFAEVTIDLEPTGPGGGYEFVDKITGGRVPEGVHPVGRRRHPAVARRRACSPATRPSTCGPILTDGKYHDVDSSEMAFKIAGSMAFKEALRKAKPVLLEPIMSVEVETPDEYMGDVIGDLNSRRGQVGGMDQRGNSQIVRAHVPLSEMFGYSTDLRSRTQGRASYSMQLRQLPADPRIGPGRDRRPRARRLARHHHRSEERREQGHGQGEVRSEQAASQRGDDGAHRPWEDDVDGGDHAGVGGGERRTCR